MKRSSTYGGPGEQENIQEMPLVTDKSNELVDERGLPRYFDMQAKLGYTKHIGGAGATRELLNLCQISSEKTLLNLGCGAGTTTPFIVNNYNCDVVAIDIKENMLESAVKWAKRKEVTGKARFTVADAQYLPFANESFDILICESVNVFIPDKRQAFGEYHRVLKPGGALGINEAVLTKEPPENAAALLADYVGNDILPTAFWVDQFHAAGFTKLISREYQVQMRDESRSQLGFFTTRDYLGLLCNMLKVTFGQDPYVRDLAKRSLSNPRDFYDFFGYGLIIGWKS